MARRRNAGWPGAALLTLTVLLAACGSTSPEVSAPRAPTATAGSATAPTGPARPATPPLVVVTPVAPVPAQYQSLYTGLSLQLDGYQAAVAAMPVLTGARSKSVVPGLELLDANANRGSALFGPHVLATVARDVAFYRAMGVGGLTLGIKLPFLLAAYEGADAARYLSFYESVASMIRAAGMSVDVELSAAFCGTVYSACRIVFPDTVTGLATMTAQQARIVIAHLHPDRLTLISEETTDALLTKDRQLDTVAGTTKFVSLALRAIGPHPGVAIGAGAATWQPPAFNRALLTLPIDYLDLHVYPIGAAEVANLVADSEMADAAGVPLVADEVWLFKTLVPSGNPSGDSVSRLNDFSFFSPLDARFATITQQWATRAGVEYDSAFWSWQMTGYATWTPALDAAGYLPLSVAADSVAIANMGAGHITPVGRAWVYVG